MYPLNLYHFHQLLLPLSPWVVALGALGILVRLTFPPSVIFLLEWKRLEKRKGKRQFPRVHNLATAIVDQKFSTNCLQHKELTLTRRRQMKTPPDTLPTPHTLKEHISTLFTTSVFLLRLHGKVRFRFTLVLNPRLQ